MANMRVHQAKKATLKYYPTHCTSGKVYFYKLVGRKIYDEIASSEPYNDGIRELIWGE